MKKTKPVLGAFSLAMINIVAVDSLRTLPFSAEYGLSLVFFYLIAAAAFFIPTALVCAELATTWPSKGGIYVWVREAFGERWGFLIIWLQWIYNIVWYPTILSFVATAIAYLINPQLAENKFYILLTISVIFWGATFINCFGMKASSSLSTFCALFGTLIPMAFIIILGIKWLLSGNPVQIELSKQQLLPSINNLQQLSFLLAIIFGLVGVEVSAAHADEVKNPSRSYPRAILYSAIIILSSLIFASLAIAIVVPHQQLNVVAGLVQAFQIFFAKYQMQWMSPIITLLIIIGGIGGVATWIIGPTKGLLVAAHDKPALKLLTKTNRHGVPIVILALQAIIFSVLSSIFLFMPSVSSSYWILTAITAQLSMMVYVGLFAAAFYLRYKKPQVQRPYKIPGGAYGIGLCCFLGLFSSIGAIALGFLPPEQIAIGNHYIFEVIIVGGILVLCAPAFIINRKKSLTQSAV